MSRINSNISSLQAIHRLSRNNSDLATRLQRLSSGLKINAGKDAPAGLIASEQGAYTFAPASPALQELCALLELEYRERPVTVVDAIVSTPNDRLKNFADAFRFKEKDE